MKKKKILATAALVTALTGTASASSIIYSHNGYDVIKSSRPFPGCSIRSTNAPENTRVIALEFFVDHHHMPHSYLVIVNTDWNLTKNSFLTIGINGTNQFAKAFNSDMVMTSLSDKVDEEIASDMDDHSSVNIVIPKLNFNQIWQLNYVAEANKVFTHCVATTALKYEMSQ